MTKTQVIILILLVALLIIIGVIYQFLNNLKKENREKGIKKIALVGILSAFSIVLYYVKFPLPFFVSFLEINFANIPVLLASYLFGPIEGVIVAIIRTIIKIPFTSTLCVGEIQDLIISISISLITGLIYQKNKTKKTALIAMILACISWVLIGVLSNAFVSIPIYIEFMFGGSDEVLINMIGAVIPNVTKENYLIKYLLLSCLPFNILLSSIIGVITFLIYKKTSNLFKRFVNNEKDNNDISNEQE